MTFLASFLKTETLVMENYFPMVRAILVLTSRPAAFGRISSTGETSRECDCQTQGVLPQRRGRVCEV